MKDDKGYCPACNTTTEEHNLEHVHQYHLEDESVQIIGLLPMWESALHSGPCRVADFWTRRLS